MMRSTTGSSGASTSYGITSEGLPVLEALTIVTRSLHNCRVFGYYSGIQKLTALMKGIVYVIIFSAFFFKVYLSNKFLIAEFLGTTVGFKSLQH
jgi:hypothetical protein